MAPPHHFKVFLSSPGDVAEERAIVRAVLDRLPRETPWKGKITIEVVSWDDPHAPTPLLASLTPQQAVDRGLPMPSACHLTVVIFWGRMGTPLMEPRKPDGTQYLSGTEYEFESARAAGKDVVLYRRTAKVFIDLEDEQFEEKRKQKQLVDAFCQNVRAEGRGVNSYETPEDFGRDFEAHAKELLNQFLENVEAAPAGAQRPAKKAAPAKPVVPPAYLDWLKTRCASVELLGLRLKQGQAVRLNNVYVPLTTTRAAQPEESPRGRKSLGGEDDSDRLLLDSVGEASAYISGNPGSGKSTFCRWLTWLACEGAVPAADVEPPDEYRERWHPNLANRLPVLVYLREFLHRLPEAGAMSCRDLEAAVAAWLDEKNAPGMSAELLAAHIERGSALLVFDGIDEVPPARRVALLGALADACEAWTRQGNRVVVTSRPYGLTDVEIRRLGLPHVPIRPLPEALQHLLVRRWFRILSDTAEGADASAGEMLRQVREQTWLSPLTENPLLLTGMCIVFGDGKGLPEDKYELYDRVADAVLYNRIPDRQRQQLVRARLAVVAHGMHTGDGLGEARHTPQAEVTDAEIDRMLRAYQEKSAWTEQHVQQIGDAREELVTQTGLLLPRGEHHAAFLHLSFQEFLAAQRLADIASDTLLDEFVGRSRRPEWRNTLSFMYGGVLATSTTPERGVRLLTDLIGRIGPDTVGLTLVAAEAVEILMRRGLRLAPAVDERLRAACVAAMRGSAAAQERALVGAALGRIGDPRFRSDAWFLPNDSLLGFVEIPEGPFTMGSDKKKDEGAYDDEMPQHEVTLPAYYIARWPVTVAQFKAFVNDPENGGFVPEDPDCVKGVANHPVVNVSWHEALKYSRWLTGKLRAWDETPEALRRLLKGPQGSAWQSTLASEAEWEKAARGTDGRIYPWGQKADPNRANYGDTGIGGTSAVGCFPSDAAYAYAVEDLSGNVWEWTRSQWTGDYSAKPGKRRKGSAPEDVPRVVRGGAFGYFSRDVRAALPRLVRPRLP